MPRPVYNRYWEYYDADIEPGKATYIEDITKISFQDSFFDYIVCMHVLEHIPDDAKAMQELYRVLKPGGTLFASVPFTQTHIEDLTITDPQEREKHFGQCDHVRYYSTDVFEGRLQKAGFVLKKSHPEAFCEILHDAKLSDIIYLAEKPKP